MQDENKLIITTEQVRKLAMGRLDGKSEAEVEQYIVELDFLAKLFLEGVVARKETTCKKRD